MSSGRVEVINSKGCSRLVLGASNRFSTANGVRASAASSPASGALMETTGSLPGGPFTGLIICVTGLSKEARKEVMTATERLGGRYSANLHPQCTHLVVQSFSGRKLEHAVKHGPKTGLLIVTLGWFVDSVRRNVRLNESLYSVKSTGENGLPLEDLSRFIGHPGTEKSCLPVAIFQEETTSNKAYQPEQPLRKEIASDGLLFSNDVIFIDEIVSTDLKKKVAESASGEGAKLLDEWFVGCNASHVVCEGSSLQRYIGHTNNLVTPLWILKSVKTRNFQQLVHLSSDLARQVNVILENARTAGEESCQANDPVSLNSGKSKSDIKNKGSIEERQKIVDFAKKCVRNRRSHRLRSCQFPIRPITPGSLLESISWSISESPASAHIHMESSWIEDAVDRHSCDSGDARDDYKASEAFDDLLRPLRESEKQELILKSHFLTILFPIDRFGELGPSSRNFFSNGGFSCIQVLECIYNFYQDSMSAEEVEVAIHTDSRHADRLRSIYASKESVEGFVSLKRIEFLGSRKSFKVLKRVTGDNNSNVYELLLRA